MKCAHWSPGWSRLPSTAERTCSPRSSANWHTTKRLRRCCARRSRSTHEEREVFPRLLEHCDEEPRRNMGEKFTTAQKTGPTHPHPQAPNQPPGLLTLGPVAAVFDRARDAARSALGG